MLFPSSRQQQPFQPLRQSQGAPQRLSLRGLWSLGWLGVLPGLILLAGSPAFAQLSQEQSDNQGKQRQTKISLDSPPSPEIAETLCEGTAQSLSGPVIITSQTVCQSGLTPPSLWWTQEQMAKELRTSGKLVNDWSAQLKTPEAPGQVRLIVNPQMWSLMDYFERYDFVSNFGLAARNFGYQTEVYNTKGTRLASYVCQVQETPENLGSNCKMNLGSSLNFSSRGSRNGLL